MASAEAAGVAELAARLRQQSHGTTASLSGLWLPHLWLVVAALGEGPIARRLLAREAAMLRCMAEDMRRYALKA